MADVMTADSKKRILFPWRKKQINMTQPRTSSLEKNNGLGLFGPDGMAGKQNWRTWVPFTNEFQLNRIERKLRDSAEAKRKRHNSEAKNFYQGTLKKLECLKTPHSQGSQFNKKDYLIRYIHWMLADLYLDEKDWEKAEESFDQGKKVMSPRTPKEYNWLGDKYLKFGHLLLDTDKRSEATNYYEEAEKHKPSLDDKANLALVKYWADQNKVDRKAMQKYLQCIKPSEWAKGRFLSVIFKGCKIDPEIPYGKEDIRDKIVFNQRILAFHTNLEWPYKNLAYGYLIQGSSGKARSNFETARKIRSSVDQEGYPEYSFWIGKISFLVKDYERCIQEFSSFLHKQIPNKLRGDYELFYSLSLAQLFFDQQLLSKTPSSDLKLNRDNIESRLEATQKLEILTNEAKSFSHQVHYFLGKIKLLQGKSDEAIQFFRAAIKGDSYNPYYLTNLADALAASSKPEFKQEAKRYYKKAHILFGDQEKQSDAEVMIALGILFREEKFTEEATRWFERAKKICPNNALVLLEGAKGYLLDPQPKFQEALEAAEKIDSSKSNILKEKYFIFGRCYIRLKKDINEAQQWIEKAINFGKEDWSAYYWLGICLAHQLIYDKAQEYLIKSLKKENRQLIRTFIQLGNIKLLQGIPEKAIRYYKAAKDIFAKESPKNPANTFYQDALYGLGKCYQKISYQQKGNKQKATIQKAIHQFEELLGLNNYHDGANYFLAVIYKNDSELEKCAEKLNNIIGKYEHKGDSQESSFLGLAYIKLGIILCESVDGNDLKKAEEMLDKAYTLGLDNEDITYYTGLIEIKTGRLEQGYKRWNQLYDKDKSNKGLEKNLKRLNYFLGINLFNQGKYNDAINKLECADGANVSAWRAEAYFKRGIELLKKNKVEQAGEFFEKAIKIKPKIDDYLIARGICDLLANNQDVKKAERYFTKVLNRNSDHMLALFYMALCNYLYQEDKQKNIAIEQFKELMNKPELENQLKDMVQFIVACEEMNRGNYDVIENLLPILKKREISNNLPFSAMTFNSILAHGLIQKYDTEAVKIIEELNDHSPDIFDYSLAIIYSLKGSVEKAVDYFKGVYQKNNTNTQIAEQYAGLLCYIAAKNVKKEEFKKAITNLNNAKKVLSVKTVTGDVELLEEEGSINRFKLTVTTTSKKNLLSFEFSITYDPTIVEEDNDIDSDFLTKPIYIETTHGRELIFEAGIKLPVKKRMTMKINDQTGMITFPIFEGDRPCGDIIIDDLNTNLAVGDKICFYLMEPLISQDFQNS